MKTSELPKHLEHELQIPETRKRKVQLNIWLYLSPQGIYIFDMEDKRLKKLKSFGEISQEWGDKKWNSELTKEEDWENSLDFKLGIVQETGNVPQKG